MNENRASANSGCPTTPDVQSADPLDITVDFLPVGFPTRPGTPIRATSLTVRKAADPSEQADAVAHNRYIRSSAAIDHMVSWHFTVDDKCIYQHLPTGEMGWHAHVAANASSIGVEICTHQGIDEAAALARAARLCVWLARQLDLVPSHAVRRHHDWANARHGRSDSWRVFVELVAFQDAVADLPIAMVAASLAPVAIEVPPAAIRNLVLSHAPLDWCECGAQSRDVVGDGLDFPAAYYSELRAQLVRRLGYGRIGRHGWRI